MNIGPLNFGSIIGFLALLALIPLIILYLIRPNPRQLNIPSLMFFVKSSGAKKLTSFFRYFMKDWLFLIQFLLLLFLVFTFPQPFTYYQHDVTASNTVIVIDVSASSQTLEGTKTRFDIAVSKALDSLGSSNSIILAKDVPYLALKEGSSSEAEDLLETLQPRETETNLGEAIILAGEVLAGKEGRVIVLSDFINTGGQDPNTAKAVLKSKGIIVDFVNTIKGNKRSNMGITNIDIDNVQTTIYVKNFDDEQKAVSLKVGSTTKQLTLAGKGTESYSFATPADATKIILSPKDDFPVDNFAFISGPKGEKVKVLLISNNPSVFLKNAFEASGEVLLTITEPPVIPDDYFDIYIVSDIDKEKILAGTFQELKKKTIEGSSFIFCAQENSEEFDYDFAPVKISGRRDGGFVNVDQLNRFTKNIDFGSMTYFLNVELENGASTIANIFDISVLAVNQVGNGKSIFFGFLEQGSDFKFSPGYPIFWTELIKFLTNRQEAVSLNFKTGEMLVLDKTQNVKTPSKNIKTNALLMDEQGIYELEDRIISANLMSKKESNVNPGDVHGTKSIEYELKPVKETRQKSWAVWLLTLALIFSFIELFYVKMRGDL